VMRMQIVKSQFAPMFKKGLKKKRMAPFTYITERAFLVPSTQD